MTIGQRLKQLREDARLTQPEFARIVGTTKQYVSQLEGGKNQTPSGTFLEAWSRHFRVSLQWLATGRGEMAVREPRSEYSDWSDVRGYAQAVGLGAGAEAQEYAETHSLKFRASSLSRKGLPAAQLAVMYGDGDSMQPRIHPGDAILFDTGDTKPRDGTLYVIQVHGAANAEYQVKRAMLLDDAVYFTADNPAGDHYWQKPRRADAKRGHIEVIGRVRWIGSWED